MGGLSGVRTESFLAALPANEANYNLQNMTLYALLLPAGFPFQLPEFMTRVITWPIGLIAPLTMPQMKTILVLLGMLTIPALFTSCLGTTRSEIVFHDEAFTDANDVVIYVYRVKAFAAAAVSWNVYLDGKVVAKLKQNSYVVLHTTPGAHDFRIGDKPRTFGGVVDQVAQSVAYNSLDRTDTASQALQNAKPHEVYYFRSQGLSSRLMTKDSAMAELTQMKLDMGL
jgi:hypothetical protein